MINSINRKFILKKFINHWKITATMLYYGSVDVICYEDFIKEASLKALNLSIFLLIISLKNDLKEDLN